MAKTAAEYAAAIAAAQNTWKSSAGNAAAQKAASSTADQLRKAAASSGVNLSGYGTANGYGTDYTKPQGSGMNANGTPNTAGLKDLGYGFSSKGDINTAPWKADTYADSVRIIGKGATDWNAERTRLLDNAFKTNDWTGYNAFDAKNNAANPTGSGSASYSVSAPSGGGYAGSSGSSGSSASDLINSSYNANYAAQLQKLKAARDQSLAALAGQDDLVKQSAYNNRNQSDVVAMQNAQKLKEAMANMGLDKSGDNLTAMAQGNAQRQGAIGDININESNQLKQLTAQRDAINNNANADDLALMQQLQAARDTALANQSNADRGFGLDLGQMMGSYNGQQTMASREADRNYGLNLGGLTGSINGQRTLQGQQFDRAGDQQQWENRLNYGQATGTFGNGQHTLDYTQMMSGLTGRMPNGQPTTAEQQRQLSNLWTVAQQTGTIPNQLADMYKIPRGTRTQDAIRQAEDIRLGQDASSRGWDSNDLGWVKTEYDMAHPSNGNSGNGYSGMTALQVQSALKSRFYDKDGKWKPNTSKESIYRSVVEYGLPDGEDDQAMLSLGLTRDDIAQFDKKIGMPSGK